MSTPRLTRAMVASGAVHLVVLGAVLALAHPPTSPSPPLRVSLVGSRGATGPDRPEVAAPAGPAALAARPPPTRGTPRAVRRTEAEPARTVAGASEGTAQAVALVTPVQSDLWMLAAEPGPSGEVPATKSAGSDVPGDAARPGGQGPAQGVGQPGGSPGSSSGNPLLTALSQRLAWSAERCAPAAVVRAARHAVPGVPLHFCLDAAGRPSDVGLLGTTGSEELDRAARDCVVPGALPLPPVPGCYTVEVRFPIRG